MGRTVVNEQLIVDVPMDVPAELVLRPAWGQERLAAVSDLNRIGFIHRDQVYQRLSALFDGAGVGTESDGGGELRSIIEWVAYYFGDDADESFPSEIYDDVREMVARFVASGPAHP